MSLSCQSKIIRVHPRSKDASVPFDDAKKGLEVCNGALSVVVRARDEQISPFYEDTRGVLELKVSCSRCRTGSNETLNLVMSKLRSDDTELDITSLL